MMGRVYGKFLGTTQISGDKNPYMGACTYTPDMPVHATLCEAFFQNKM